MDNGRIENGNSNGSLTQADVTQEEGLLQIALRHRRTILWTTGLFLVAAFLYILSATPIYTSTSRLYVEQSGPRIIGDFEGTMATSKSYLYTQAEMLKSTPIVGEVADNPQIRKFRTFNEIDNLIAYLKKNLVISVGKKDDIVSVAFDSPYPQEAASVVNAVVDSYVKYHSIRKQTTVSKVLDILQKEKVIRDKELSDKYKEMVEFTRENGVVSFDSKGENVAFQRLIMLSEALTDAQLMTINARADYEAVKAIADNPSKVKQFEAALPTTGIRVLVNDVGTQLETELKDAEIELENIGSNVTKDHPAVRAMQAKIDYIKSNLEEQKKNFSDTYIEVMQQRWKIAEQKEQTLAASFHAQREAAQDLGVKAAEYSMLQSELERAERICEILDDRIKELNVTEDTGALNISILEVARCAEESSKPQKAKIMAIALVLGLIFAWSFAVIRDWADVRLRSADEVSAILGIPVLGTVPTMTEEQTIAERGIKAWLDFKPVVNDLYQRIHATQAWGYIRKAAKKFMPGVYQRMRTAAISTGLIRGQIKAVSLAPDGSKTALGMQGLLERGQKVYLEPKSVIAEAYRTIRTAVFFGVPKGHAKTILITSPDAGDGKSTLASNLAIAMAQAGQKTLLLDADFRKPVQHNIFNFENDTGLSSVLAGIITLDEALQKGPVEGLDVLSCGPEVPNPSEILNSEAFTGILKDELTKRYNRIIIDSPPVGPVADSQILSASSDITLLVLRAEKSTRKHSQQSCDVLQSVGGRLLGAVVNDVPRRHNGYGYYSGYGYYRSYGYYGDREKQKAVAV
ncbi:MAG: polysaccharide biosynthesis tyrosine autokinase [Sedimentisphaerales bacterium]|nr:polysaccharide biosynthesis tyrosine autokinase [Sedimentisphaerales bacterium]